MSKLNTKTVGMSFLLTMGMVFSMSASAEPVSVESSLTQAVVSQGQQMIQELSTQLTESISNEIKSFSIDDALIWLSVEGVDSSENTNKAQITNKKSAE